MLYMLNRKRERFLYRIPERDAHCSDTKVSFALREEPGQPLKKRANAMTASPVSDAGTPQSVSRKPPGRIRITRTVVAVAAAGLLAVLAFAFGSSSYVAGAAAPVTLVNSFSGEIAVPAGAGWQWITQTDTENFADTTSRAVITGSVVLGSANGAAVSGRLGVCYQAAAGGVIANTNWEIINFTAPVGQWVTQTVSGTVVPAAIGAFKVGLCAYGTSANLTYSAAFGAGAGTAIVAIDSGP